MCMNTQIYLIPIMLGAILFLAGVNLYYWSVIRRLNAAIDKANCALLEEGSEDR